MQDLVKACSIAGHMHSLLHIFLKGAGEILSAVGGRVAQDAGGIIGIDRSVPVDIAENGLGCKDVQLWYIHGEGEGCLG